MSTVLLDKRAKLKKKRSARVKGFDTRVTKVAPSPKKNGHRGKMNVGGGGSIYLLKANFSLRLEKVLEPFFENSAQMQTFLEKHTPLELSQPNMTWL